MTLNTIGKRVKYIRINILDLNQTDFSKLLGYKSHVAVVKIENGDVDLSIEHAKLISQMANVNYEWLIEGIGEISKSDLPIEAPGIVDKINSIFNTIDQEGLDLVNPHNIRRTKILEELRAAINEMLEARKRERNHKGYKGKKDDNFQNGGT